MSTTIEHYELMRRELWISTAVAAVSSGATDFRSCAVADQVLVNFDNKFPDPRNVNAGQLPTRVVKSS